MYVKLYNMEVLSRDILKVGSIFGLVIYCQIEKLFNIHIPKVTLF
jgi:hypothetical protein